MSCITNKFDNRSTNSSQYFQKRHSALNQLHNFQKQMQQQQRNSYQNQIQQQKINCFHYYSPPQKNAVDYITEKTMSSKSIQKKFRDFSRQSLTSKQSKKQINKKAQNHNKNKNDDKDFNLKQIHRILNNQNKIISQYLQWINKQKSRIKSQFEQMLAQLQSMLNKKQSQIVQILNRSFVQLAKDLKQIKKQIKNFYDDKIKSQKKIQLQNKCNKKLQKLKQQHNLIVSPFYSNLKAQRNQMIKDQYFRNGKNDNRILIKNLELEDQRMDEAGRAYKFYKQNKDQLDKIMKKTIQIKKYINREKVNQNQIDLMIQQSRNLVKMIIFQQNKSR